MSVSFDPKIANYLTQAGDLSKLVLNRVAAESAASGWSLSKLLNRNPDDVQATLNELREKELVASDGSGLEAMYYLTPLGYSSRDLF